MRRLRLPNLSLTTLRAVRGLFTIVMLVLALALWVSDLQRLGFGLFLAAILLAIGLRLLERYPGKRLTRALREEWTVLQQPVGGRVVALVLISVVAFFGAVIVIALIIH
jgi:hypothetical protein